MMFVSMEDPYVKRSESFFIRLMNLILEKDRELNLLLYLSEVLAQYSEFRSGPYTDGKIISVLLEKLIHLMKIIPKSKCKVLCATIKAYL